MSYQFRTVSPSDFYHTSLLSPSPPLPSSHVMPLTPTLPSSKHARYLSEASNMQVPHPHSPMNMDTPICPLPPNSSSMVNAPQLVTPVRSSPHHCQVTSVTLSPRVFEALLSAVLNVNPWMCARGESKDKWQEVSVLVKQANACEGRSADTLKNKVYSLLKAVETRGVSTRNSLARDAGLFTAISGRLYSVAALKNLAEETRESDHEKVKLAAEAQKTAGLNLRNAMMKGHSRRSLKKCTQDDLFSATGHSDIAQEDSSGSGISMLTSRHTSKSKKCREDTLESIIGLIRTSVDARKVMISEQRKQTEAFVLEARAAREEVRAAREEVRAAREEARAAREEEARAAREEARAAREEARAAREEARAAREEARAAREEARAAREEARAAREEARAAREEARAAREEARAAREEARAAREEARAAREEARAAREEARAAREEARAAREEARAAREEARAAREEARAAREEARAAREEARAAREEARAAREEARAAREEARAAREEARAAREEARAAREEARAAREEARAAREEARAAREEARAAREEARAAREEARAAREEARAAREEARAAREEARAAREEVRAAREEAHAAQLASDEIAKSLIDVLRQGLLG
ncbi:hypothetical protein BU17DRAFT_94718 [Hysterangium stoloniferum]|nr:hypothetical protein BU17DRAFT_94718 [Hysterangium stoloniferum]